MATNSLHIGAKVVATLIVGGVAIYHFGSPFVAETSKIDAQARKVQDEVTKIRLEAKSYDQKWEKKMAEKESALKADFPEELNSAHVLNYLMTNFEESKPKRIVFQAVNHQLGSATEFKIKLGKKSVSPRHSKYKIRARIYQDTVVPYLEHIEKYPGLYSLEGFNLNTPSLHDPLLEMELQLGFYLQPKEWEVKKTRVVGSDSAVPLEPGEDQNWFSLLAVKSSRGKVERGPAVDSYAGNGDRNPQFKVQQIMGDGIIVNESLFEVGDSVKGWKLVRIDAATKSAIFKNGDVTRRMTVP